MLRHLPSLPMQPSAAWVVLPAIPVRAHTPQPEDPPEPGEPTPMPPEPSHEPDEPEAPPIGDPPAQPGEVPHAVPKATGHGHRGELRGL
jgi:hypothetical protein